MTVNIADSFNYYFEMVPATTEALKEAAYRLRFQVYSLETGHLNPDNFPDAMEKDEDDPYSEHFLIRHRETGENVATSRLILPDPENTERLFPIERLCQLERTDLLENVPRTQIAEASRVCVSQHFKRRAGEKNTLIGVSSQNISSPMQGGGNRQALPNFALPLLACLIRMSLHHGITHWYAFMEPALSRLFKTFGLNSTPVGPLVDHYGMRRPYVIKLAEVLCEAKNSDKAVWDLLTNYGKFWPDTDIDKGWKLPSLAD